MQKHPELISGDNRFIALLTDRFGEDLWFATPDETRSIIAKIKSFYNTVKDAHRHQTRTSWGKYFNEHIIPVTEILLSFPDATLWDAIVALWHDFVEDHRELPPEEALLHIETTFGPQYGPRIRTSIQNLTKFSLPDYLDGSIKEKFLKKTPLDQEKFLEVNAQDLSGIRGEKYFTNLEENWSDGDLRVKTADSIHNLMTCHLLWTEKIQKTISEKEAFLLPILQRRNLPAEADALAWCISITKLILLKQRISQEQFAILKWLTHPGTSKAIIALFESRAK
jgi:(p)ppGpp synthase/HD superfamily hydrolase